MEAPGDSWQFNYFNYFTEIEDHFRKVRGTGMFLFSPLDWALIETWKDAGVPLEAVLRGVEAAFEKWRAQKKRRRTVNSLAYCAQAVVEEAERMAGNVPASSPPAQAPFSREEVEAHLARVAAEIRAKQDPDLAGVVESIEGCRADLDDLYGKLEALEQRLSGLEDKMIAVARARQSEQELMEIRAELDRHLRPYRGKMTGPQLVMLEMQYLDRASLERAGLPRLSLFYLR
jgi:hypothetical protein